MAESKDTNTGISNRETAREEEHERREHPSRAPDAEGRDASAGEEIRDEVPDGQTSSKAGSRSSAQKASDSKYVNRPAPPSRKVAGAYGREEDDMAGEK